MSIAAHNRETDFGSTKPEVFSFGIARVPELDGIRGTAIGMVLIYHFFLNTNARPASKLAYALVPGRLAWSGVDLFFVLSGFLIGGILLDARESSNYFRVFYTRRFFRIIPFYSVSLATAFAIHSLIRMGLADRLSWMMKDALPWTSYMLFVQNFLMAHRTTLGAFGLTVTWSLAVEEQFYLTLPFAIRVVNPRRLPYFLGAGILLAPALRITIHALWPEHIYSWIVLMPCRADALLLGVVGALLMRDSRCRAWLEERQKAFLCLLCLLIFGLGTLTLSAAGGFGVPMVTIGFSWLAVFYLTVLLYALLWRQSILSRCLRLKWLCWLGSISYAAYLIHDFVLGLFYGVLWSRPPVITSLEDLGVSILALLTTLIICQLSWKYLERPLVQMGHRVKYQFEPIAVGPATASLTVTER
jgi:peptidoglycan/LPS O-acetylase OafA/YrhL